MEVSSKAENKVEENLFTIDDKWVTNEIGRQRCKRSNTEKMKLNGIGISKYGDKKKVAWLKIMLVILTLL